MPGKNRLPLSRYAWVNRLLRIPLMYKILVANSAIVALGAIGGTVITVWHVLSFPGSIHYELIIFFGVVGLAISFMVNFLVLKLALTPLDRLQAGVDAVRQGRMDVRLDAGDLSDERFDRLITTFNQMLARLEEDAQRLHRVSGEILQAQEEERRRVARELHDEAAQALTSLLVRLRLLERSATPEEARQQVQELRKLTAQALDDVRRVALELRPSILDDLGLEAALSWRIEEFNAAHPTRVTLDIQGLDERRLPGSVELVLYRVAQEALTNIARHAQARQARVTLQRDDAWLRLCVADDGMGFDPTQTQRGHVHGLGLPGMRERLTLVGGDLVIETRPGQGTQLIARVPLHARALNGGRYAHNSYPAGG